MDAPYTPALRKQYVMLLWHLGISSLDIATTLRIDPQIVKRDLRAGLPSGPILPPHGSDPEYAQAYVAAVFGELQLPQPIVTQLIGVIESHPNSLRWPVLQERIRTMRDQLAAATARVDALEDALITVQRTVNGAIGKNRSRKWNENLSKRVDEVRFSLRANDVLKALNVKLYWELAEKSEADLSKFCDRRRLAEIKEILADLGLSLGTDLTGFPGKKVKPPEAPKDPGKTHVNDMRLSVGTINILRDNDLEFADEVAGCTEAGVLKLLKNSKKRLKEVTDALRDLGMSFKQ